MVFGAGFRSTGKPSGLTLAEDTMGSPVELHFCYNKTMYSKGFAPIAVVIAVVALLAGGAVYFATSPKKLAKESELPVPTSKENFLSGEAESKKEEAASAQPKVELKSALSASDQKESHTDQAQKTGDPWRDAIVSAPVNLALPLVVADIEETETVLSPYGIIRKSGDGGIGHGGIDFPLERGSPIYAAADGVIIKNYLEDPGGGKTVDVLILPGGSQGEGWIFKYDHIDLGPGLAVGSNVKKGQKIGTNGFEQRGNNHIGLEYHIKNFTIARSKICWVDRLEPVARQQLEDAFDRIKKTQAFLQFWQTAAEEGYYQYKGLLDQSKYSNGPQLCYRLGTDGRVPMD